MPQELYSAGPPSAYKIRESRVLRTIRAGKVASVLKLNTSDSKVAEIFSMSQPDAIWLCTEHTSSSFEAIENQIRAAKIYDVDSMVRVMRGSYSDYIRPLEMDAAGLIVPHIINLQDAKNVRDMTKFAPLGKRAADGGNNDAKFTKVSFNDYLVAANQERFVCYQIEDPEVIDQLDDIAALDGVDALFFGPGDMSVALGIPGQINDPKINEMRKNVAQVARKHNKIAATVCNPDTVRDFADMGYNLLSLGADVVALSEYADKMMAAFDRV